ncbi:hypothetical protein BDR26DRAFT_603353 [Obelidium mucronatum]|nr:hypothetical protein BDR26DRAFT_603353 [Obelidium mucronatum]
MGKEVAKNGKSKAAAKAVPAAKDKKAAVVAKKEESEDEEEDDEEEEEAADEEDEDDDEEESDDEDEEEEKPVSKKRAAAEDDDASPPKKQQAVSSNDEPKTVFVGNLSFNADEDTISEHFSVCGEVVSVRIINGPDGRKKGFGYVEFADSEAAKKALELADSEIDGRAIRVDLSQPKPERKPEQKSAPADTLFVGNLSFDASEDGLKGIFAEHGEVTSVRIPTDRESGNPKGFAYVQFADIESAKAALEALNGHEYEGRAIRLDFSQPRTEGGGGGRGGRGGRGRGRGGY